MDENEHVGSTGKESPEVLPSLIKHISSNKVAGFDSVEGNTKINDQSQATYSQISNPSATVSSMSYVSQFGLWRYLGFITKQSNCY